MPIKNTISPMGPSQSRLVFKKKSQDSCCWGKCWSSLLLEDSKKRKKTPRLIRLIKLENKQNTKPERSWLDICINHNGTQPAVWSSKDFSKKKKKNLMWCFIPYLFIRVFMKQYVVQMKLQSHRRYLPEHWSMFSN